VYEGLLTDSGKEWGVGWGHFFLIFAAATIPLRLRNLHKGSLKFKDRGTLQTRICIKYLQLDAEILVG
jgi:hypothetical protein